jgi:hypothetical protein
MDPFSSLQLAFQKSLQNQFLASGLMLMLGGSLLALCRTVPAHIFRWLKSQFIVSVDVLSPDPVYDWLSIWLDQHPYSNRARALTATARRHYRPISQTPDNCAEPSLPEILFTPAPGNHFFVYHGHLAWLSRERKEPTADNPLVMMPRETFMIRIVGRRQSLVRDLLEDVRLCAHSAMKEHRNVFVTGDGYWRSTGIRLQRSLDSVILPEGVAEDALASVREFLQSAPWYQKVGVPWRCGWLLEGLPGSGKTSLIGAIASELNLDLYCLSLVSSGMNDSRLADMIANMNPGSILLMEDIDAATQGRTMTLVEEEGQAVSGVTFSGLLNAIDGIAAKEGTLLFMTTNHAERLDPALIRPGRIDHRIHFSHATPEQVGRMLCRFYPDSDTTYRLRFMAALEATQSSAEPLWPLSTATLQQHLLRFKTDPEGALLNLESRLQRGPRRALHAVFG